jgi:hypothetical protein
MRRRVAESPVGQNEMISRITSVVMCILCTAWLARAPDWEPLIALISAIGVYVGVEFSQYPKHKQHKDDSHTVVSLTNIRKVIDEDESSVTPENPQGYTRKPPETIPWNPNKN